MQLGVSGATQGAEAGSIVSSVSATLSTTVALSVDGTRNEGDAGVYDATLLRKQKASLNILTQDGDSIAIRFRSREAVAVQSTGQTAGAVDAAASVSSDLQLYSFASGQVQIAVEGQLDDDELTAIGDLLGKVHGLATDFFGGDMEAAFSAAADIGFDASEIASFSLRMSVRESMRAGFSPAAARPAPELPAAPTGEAAASGAAAGSAPAPASPGTAPVSAVQTPAPAEVAAPATTPEQPAAEEVPPAAPASAAADAPTLQSILGDYVQQVLGNLAGTMVTGKFEFSMSLKLRMVVAALQVPPQPEAAASPGAKLLGDTLQKVAASQA
jgi:hypothetical protein